MADEVKPIGGYGSGDKLAIALACLAGVMAIILFLAQKTPLTVVSLLIAMIALSIYPILHFARSRPLRVALMLLAVAATVAFGWSKLPKNNSIDQAKRGTSTPAPAPSSQAIQDDKADSSPSPSTATKNPPAKKRNLGQPKPAATSKPSAPQSAASSVATSGNGSPATGSINQGPGSALSFGQQGGITAGTVITGPLPPRFTLTYLNENSPVGPELFRTDWKLEVQTQTLLSLHVRAEAADITREMRMSPCMQVLELHDGSASGENRASGGVGSCDVHTNVTSGSYQITVFTAKPEKVNLTYAPD